jgi:hypothetical protein
MTKTLLVTILAVSVAAGTGYVGLRTLGENAKATFDELNRALEESSPGTSKASAQDAAAWIERYRSGARKARCSRGRDGWDYVCVFRDGDGRRRKVGLMVDSRQPTQMSPLAGPHQPLPAPVP